MGAGPPHSRQLPERIKQNTFEVKTLFFRAVTATFAVTAFFIPISFPVYTVIPGRTADTLCPLLFCLNDIGNRPTKNYKEHRNNNNIHHRKSPSVCSLLPSLSDPVLYCATVLTAFLLFTLPIRKSTIPTIPATAASPGTNPVPKLPVDINVPV